LLHEASVAKVSAPSATAIIKIRASLGFMGSSRERTVGNVNPKTFKLQYRCKNPPADRYRLA
jgi:hypothetical protein